MTGKINNPDEFWAEAKRLGLMEPTAERVEIERLRTENTAMKGLLREVLEQILYPLAQEETALGKIAEGFGQAMRAAIEKVTR